MHIQRTENSTPSVYALTNLTTLMTEEVHTNFALPKVIAHNISSRPTMKPTAPLNCYHFLDSGIGLTMGWQKWRIDRLSTRV